jgi:nicotinate-nucleotide adenylyltransferase
VTTVTTLTRVALFGGSFNPPHVAHQLVALYVLETQPVDELWLVPTFRHAFGKELASYDDRVAMCERLAAPLGPRVRVSRAEADLAAQPGFVSSRTLHLLAHLAAQDPAATFRLVVGADILAERDQWYRWDDVVARAPLIVLGRAGHPLPPGSHATEVAMPAVSSTEIRDWLAAQQPVDSLLPRQVLGYIAERGLYR